MKSNQETLTRRKFCQTLAGVFLGGMALNATGCSVFKGKEKREEYSNAFEIDEEEEEEEEQKEDVFASERKKQREMSEFLAENGRDSKKKKSKVRPGDDFLLSSKAKEIYANTER